MLPITVVFNPTAIVHYFVAVVSLGCAFVLTRNLEAYVVASRVVLLVVQAVLIMFVLVKGLTTFPLDQVLAPHTSSNGVTSRLILLQASYSVLNFLVRRRASSLTSLLTLVICLIGYGRGSILASALIVIVNLIAELSWKNRWRSGLLIAGVTLAAATYGVRGYEFVRTNTKIGVGLHDPSREAMIGEYLGRIDAWTIFSGASYRGTIVDTDFQGNPHNAYIRAHHLFGLPYVLVIFLFPVVMMWRRQRFTLLMYSASMFLVILFRCFTEPILFPTPFDVFFFAVCFALANEEGAKTPARAPG
jgi:hypothetical protein